MTFPSSFFPTLTSESPKKDIQAVPVGAGATQQYDHYFYHEKFISWINDAKKKMPKGTPKLRREAFLADSLLNGTIFPFLLNTLLKSYDIETEDNKLYSEAISEIEDYIEQIELMKKFRDSFLDQHFLVGDTYLRADPDKDNKIAHLEPLEPSTITTYTDPWDSSVIAYHQKALINSSWSWSGISEQVDSWFIPFQNTQVPQQIDDIYTTFIQNRGVGNDLRVFDLFQIYKTKYNISDITNLRIASSERIFAIHNSINFKNTDYDFDDYHKRSFAPIDPIISAIFLKRLLIDSSPNLIFTILAPFLHAKFGLAVIGKDSQNNDMFIYSYPTMPVPNDPYYNQKMQAYNSFNDSFEKVSNEIQKTFKEGGTLTTPPTVSIAPIESNRTVTHQFIKGLIDILNDEIFYSCGLPKALISASGSELATSRTIASIYNTNQEGKKLNYESLGNKLITLQFAGRTWTTTTKEKDKDGALKEVPVTYKFEDIKARFVLQTLDTKNLLEEAQATNYKADTLVKLKAAGASKEDLQAIGDEEGFGLLGLDNFGTAQTGQINQQAANNNPDMQAQIKAMLPAIKAAMLEAMEKEGLISAKPTDPSGFDDKLIVKKVNEIYEEAKKDVDHLFEE